MRPRHESDGEQRCSRLADCDRARQRRPGERRLRARFFGRDGGALCFLGDVTGHDAKAAALARELEALVTEMAPRMAPGALLSWLNAELEAAWPPDLFVSAVCFSFDADTQRGAIALAGQMPPVIRSPWTAAALDVTAGPPLGILAGERYRERRFGLSTGELLVAVTDGITIRSRTTPTRSERRPSPGSSATRRPTRTRSARRCSGRPGDRACATTRRCWPSRPRCAVSAPRRSFPEARQARSVATATAISGDLLPANRAGPAP